MPSNRLLGSALALLAAVLVLALLAAGAGAMVPVTAALFALAALAVARRLEPARVTVPVRAKRRRRAS
jgi:hypothetical protein